MSFTFVVMSEDKEIFIDIQEWQVKTHCQTAQ